MKTAIIENYTFDKDLKQITFSDFTTLDITKIISITNVTNGVQVFYNKLPGFTGTVATNVLTLAYNTNTTNFNNSDKLCIEMAMDNLSTTIVPLLTRVAGAGNSAEIVNYNSSGAVFIIDTKNYVGGGNLSLRVQAKDVTSNEWTDITGAATASISLAGKTTLVVHPGVTEAANAKVSFPLPRYYRLAWGVTGTSIDFSVSVNYIN